MNKIKEIQKKVEIKSYKICKSRDGKLKSTWVIFELTSLKYTKFVDFQTI